MVLHTVEVFVVLAQSFERLLCLVDLSLDPVALSGVVSSLLLPSFRLRLLLRNASLPFFDRLVELPLSLFHLRIGRLSLQPIVAQAARSVISLFGFDNYRCRASHSHTAPHGRIPGSWGSGR